MAKNSSSETVSRSKSDAAEGTSSRTVKKSFLARVKDVFHRDRLKKDLKKVEKLTEKDSHRRELQRKLFAPTQAKKKKAPRKRFTLQSLLTKAGVEMPAQMLKHRLFLLAVVISLMLSLSVVVLGHVNQRSVIDILIFSAGFWTAGFALILILIALCASAYLDILIIRRRQQLELVLPDYLQLVAANIGAGMPIDRALWYAVRPRFGVLAKEIEDVAKRVITGEDLPQALRDFTTNYESPVLRRSINLLLEGIAAGGKIADLLHKISNDIVEQRILRQEMAANVMTYVIFISFASVLAAPILFGLSTQLLIVIQSIASTLPSGGSSTGLSVTPDVIKLVDFKIFSLTVLCSSSIMSALIISVIRRGTTFEGLRFIPVFLFVSILLYFLATTFFGSLFGGLI